MAARRPFTEELLQGLRLGSGQRVDFIGWLCESFFASAESRFAENSTDGQMIENVSIDFVRELLAPTGRQ